MGVEKSNKPIIVDLSSSDESNSPPSDSDFDAAEVISSSTSWYFSLFFLLMVSADAILHTLPFWIGFAIVVFPFVIFFLLLPQR